jgi:sugar phosphate isomerase/epimerase
MPLGPDDLVLCAATALATPLLDRLAPARAAGYAGVSVWPFEVEALRAGGVDDDELRTRIADAGLAVGELDAITTWLPGHTPPPAMDAAMAAQLLANTAQALCPMGEAIGARSVTVVEYYGAVVDVDVAAEAFAGVCDVAAEHGLVVHLEPLPWTGIPDLTAGWAIVRGADRPNGGLLVDSWHLFRSGSTLEQLAAIPGSAVLGVQLDDAPATPEADLEDETMHRRLLPGEGELDLVGFVRTLREIGSPAPIGVEVFSDALAALPVAEVAQRTAAATRAVLAAAATPAPA